MSGETVTIPANDHAEMLRELRLNRQSIQTLEAEKARLTESVLHERRQVVLAKQSCPTPEKCACLWRDGLKAAIAAEAEVAGLRRDRNILTGKLEFETSERELLGRELTTAEAQMAQVRALPGKWRSAKSAGDYRRVELGLQELDRFDCADELDALVKK